MKVFKFQIVDSLPAIYDERTDLLVISDLHLGLEKTMTAKGNYIPQNQLDMMKEDIKKAKDEEGAERILINGDLKNQFKTSYSENEEIKELLNFLAFNFEEIIVVKGNHDTFMDSALKDNGIEMKEYHLEDGILFVHGDRELEDIGVEDEKSVDAVVIGHEHPAITLKDDIGVKEKIPALLHGNLNEERKLVVLPAFSRIANGTSVNEVPKRELLSPVLKNSDKNGMKAVGISREAGLLKFPEISKL
ncbi:MAG: hypothetical protein BRC29_05050 [Nanohaloarchaea archaeon SW_7_43_1]|nr:MAG: hypothetical protein BRC29_05050 [Nanohaloarchaea archaeon SW_7_43_1]